MNRYESTCADLRFYANDKRRNEFTRSLLNQAIDAITELNENRKVHGHWIVDVGKTHTTATCSECGTDFYYANKGQYHIDKSDYCPNCGAAMRGRESE